MDNGLPKTNDAGMPIQPQMHVLIVEDDDKMARLLKEEFEEDSDEFKFIVVIAPNLEEAICKLEYLSEHREKKPYDVIVPNPSAPLVRLCSAYRSRIARVCGGKPARKGACPPGGASRGRRRRAGILLGEGSLKWIGLRGR